MYIFRIRWGPIDLAGRAPDLLTPEQKKYCEEEVYD